MADFDKNLQPIIKSTGYQPIDVKLNAAKAPGMAFASPGGGGVSDLSREEDVFAKLKAAAAPSAPKGIFVSDAELAANKRYKFFNPTIGDYEDFAAQGQEWYKQATNGVLKGANLAATTIAGGFGTLYGVGKALLPGGKFSDIFQNEVMTNLNKWNEYVDNEVLPNYYTAAERNAEWYAKDNWLTWNFVFDKLIKNSGYAVGAMYGGNIANAVLLGAGAKVGGLLAKGAAAAEASQAFKLFTPLLRNTARAFSAGKNVEAAALLESRISSIADLSTRTSQLANIAKQTGQFARFSDAARRTAVATYSSAGEASFEALQTSKEYRDNLVEEFRKERGFDPTGDDLIRIDREAAEVGKTSFLGNMALLAITEYGQLPYLIGSNYSASRQAANSLMGQVDETVVDAVTGKLISKNVPKTKFGKLYEGAKRAQMYVFDPKESAQEILQYGLQVGTQNYFKKAEEAGEADLFVDGFLYGLFGKDEFGKGVGALVSKEGIEGGILGGITGGLMQARGNYMEKKSLAKNTENFLNMINNAPTFKEAFQQRLKAANRGVVLQQQHRDAIINGDKLEATDLKYDLMHTYLEPRIKYGRFDMVMEDLAELKQAGLTEKGLAELKEQGMANINDDVNSFQKRISSIENSAKDLNNLYQALNIRYAGETVEIDGEERLKYSPRIIDMLAYAGSKIANYDVRLPQLNAKLSGAGINTQAILQDIIETGTPNAEATREALNTINSMDVTSDVKDELKGTLDDVIELSLRRRMFINEYDSIKNNPLNYERPEEEIADVDVRQKEGRKKTTKTLEVGKTYSLAEPITLEKGKLVLAPKFTVLSSTLGGEFEVQLPDGTTTFFSPEQFDKYNISDEDNTSQELEDILNQSIDDVLSYPAFKNVVEKPQEGVNKLGYINSLANQKLTKAVINRFNMLAKELLDAKAKEKEIETTLKDQATDINKQQNEVADQPGDVTVVEIPFGERIDTGETGPLKSAAAFFNSSSNASDDPNSPLYEKNPAPHVVRARIFLNNARRHKKRDKFRAITFTYNQEADLGLSGTDGKGVTELSYGANWATQKEKVNDLIDGFVAQVYVEVDGKNRYFIDQNGNRIKNAEGKDVQVGQQVDLGKVVFETRPSAKEYNRNNDDRFRTKEKDEFLANMEKWKAQREILLGNPAKNIPPMAAKDLPTNSFTISKGFPILTNKVDDKFVKNKVGDALVTELQIETQSGLLQISTGTPIVHNGENMLAKPGLVYIQDGDILQVLNNNMLGSKKAKAVYEVIKSLINEMQQQAEAGKSVQLDRQKLFYLRSILIYAKHEKDVKGNQLWIDIESMSVKLGNNTYSFKDFLSNETDVVKAFSTVYHSANKRTLDKKEPYFEFVFEEGKLTFKKWVNYQTYLLSGRNRPVEDVPFITNVAKTSEAIPYNYRGKYATLAGFTVGEKNTNFTDPVQNKEEPPITPAPPAPPTPSTGSKPSDVEETLPAGKIGDFTVNDGSTNTMQVANMPVEFVVTTYTTGKIKVDIDPESEGNKKAIDSLSGALNEDKINQLKDKIPGLDQNSSKEETVLEFFRYQIMLRVAQLKVQKEAEEQANQTPPQPPVSDVEKRRKESLESIKYKYDKGGDMDIYEATIVDVDGNKKTIAEAFAGAYDKLIKKINSIYDAELAALEQTKSEGPVSDVEAKRKALGLQTVKGLFEPTQGAAYFRIILKGDNFDVLAFYEKGQWSIFPKQPNGEFQASDPKTGNALILTPEQRKAVVKKYAPKELIDLLEAADKVKGIEQQDKFMEGDIKNYLGLYKKENLEYQLDQAKQSLEVYESPNYPNKDAQERIVKAQKEDIARLEKELAALEGAKPAETKISPSSPSLASNSFTINASLPDFREVPIIKTSDSYESVSNLFKKLKSIKDGYKVILVNDKPFVIQRVLTSFDSITLVPLRESTGSGFTGTGAPKTFEITLRLAGEEYPLEGEYQIDTFLVSQNVSEKWPRSTKVEITEISENDYYKKSETKTPPAEEKTSKEEPSVTKEPPKLRPGYKDTRLAAEGEQTAERITERDIEAFKAWHAKNVPNIPFEMLDNMITINKNEKAWGVFESGVAKFFKKGLRGTEYHEIFEGIWKGFLSENERQALLDEFKSKPGYFLDRESGRQIAFTDATDRQAKERIADDFADFRLGKLPARTLSQKITRFFKAILEFFKSFVQKPSLKQGLFESIEAGRFSKSVLPESIKTAQPEYRKQRILADGYIVTEDWAWNIVQDMAISISGYILNRNNDNTVSNVFNLKSVTGAEVYDYIRAVYQENGNLEILGESLFNDLFRENVDYLRTVGVSIDTNSLVSVNDEEGNNRLYSPEAFEVDFKKNMKFAIKFLISTQPAADSKTKDSNGLPVMLSGAAGVHVLSNFNRTFATLLSKLSNIPISQIPDRLVDLFKSDGNYYRVIRALGGNMNATEGSQLFNFEKDEDWRLYIQFVQAFNKSKPDAVVESRSATPDGVNVISKPAERASAINAEKYSWLSNIKTLATESGSMVVQKKLNYSIDTQHSGYPKTFPSTNEARIAFLKNIGINFPATAITNQNTFVNAVNAIWKYGSEEIANVNKFTKADSSVTKLATMYVDSINPDHDTTRLNVENKRTGNYSDSNAVSVFEEHFNNVTTLGELLKIRPELNDEFSKNSLLIKKGGRFFDAEGNRTEEKLRIGVVDGIIEDDGGTTVGTVTKGERFTLEINQNLKGNYYILIPAESATERTYNIGNQIKFEDVNTEIGNSELFSLMKLYLDDEIELALDWKNREKLSSVGKNRAKQLRMFREILSEDLVNKIEKVIATETKEKARVEIKKIISENNDAIEASILETVSYLNAKLDNDLRDTGEVLDSGEGVVEYANLDTDFAENKKLNKQAMSESDYNSLLSFININQMISNIELHKFIFGDPYQFKVNKGKLDEPKRIKTWLSPRRKTFNTKEANDFLNNKYNNVTDDIVLSGEDITRHTFKDFTKTITLTDPVPQSRYIKEMGGYEESDGFSLIGIGTFREVKWKNGEWPKEAEKWYQWQMAYTRQKLSGIKKPDGNPVYEYDNPALQKHDENLITQQEPYYVLEVVKPIVSGAKPDMNRIEGVIDKYSQMPLFFKAVEGTHLQDLYTQMLLEEVGYVVYKSGRKEGVRKTHDVYNGNGTFNFNEFDENSVENIAWSTYGIQVENSYEEDKEQTRGSQLMKNASMDMFENGREVIPGAAKLYSEIQKTHNEFHELQYQEFLNKLGIEDLGDGYRIVDPKNVSETLEYELLRRDASQNVIDTIRLDENGQFRIPFEASSAYEEIRKVLFSIINKSLLSPSMGGKPYVQVPATLWENRSKGRRLIRKTGSEKEGFTYTEITKKQYEALSPEDKKSVSLASDTLKFYENKDGERYMEVMIPNYWKKYFPGMTDEQVLEHLNKPENQKILFGVGFRIPHQAASSTEIFKVKGFLHPSMGSTVVVPSEMVAKAGSDFDIDKLNMYLKSLYIDSNDNVKLIEYKGSKGETIEFYKNDYNQKINNEIGRITRYDNFRDKLLEIFDIVEASDRDQLGNPTYLKSLLTAEQIKFYNFHRTTINEITEQAVSEKILPSEYIVNQIGKVANDYEKLTKKLLSNLGDKYAQRMYKKSLENRYYELLQELVTLPGNFDRLMTPVGDAGLPDVAKELDIARQDEEANIKHKLLSKSFLTSLRHAFLLGKKWVGIAAVNITGHSIAQKINAYIDPKRLGSIDKYDASFLGNMSLAIPHNTVEVDGEKLISLGGRNTVYLKKDKKGNRIIEFISDRLSGYTTAFVDVAKDPYIMKILRSDLVVGTAMFMERIGAGELTPFFLNQPIIIDYLKYLDRIGSRALFSSNNASEIASKYPIESGMEYNLKQEFPIDPDTGLVDFEKSKANLLSSIDINAKKDADFYLKQRAVFTEFLKIAKMAEFSFKFTQAYNYDTTRVRTTEGILRKALRTQTAEDANIISSINDVFDQTFIGKQRDMIMKEVKALSSLFKLDGDVFYEVIDQVLKPFAMNEYMALDDFDRIVKKIKTAMIDYLVQNKSDIFSKSTITNLLSGKNNIAKQLIKLQKKYPENELLSNLEARYSKLEGGSVTVTLKAKPSDAPSINRYINMMRELKTIDSKFYNNLVLTSLLQGSYNTRVSISDIVPLEDRAELIAPLFNRTYSPLDIQSFSNDGVFFRTNFSEKTIVPTYSPKFSVYNGEVGYQKTGFIKVDELGVIPGDGRIIKLSKQYSRSNHANMDFIKVNRYQYAKGLIIDITNVHKPTSWENFKDLVKNGERSKSEIVGYKKVKYPNGESLQDEKGNFYFKMVNLYGDGDIAKVYRIDGLPSSIPNNTFPVQKELDDTAIINAVNANEVLIEESTAQVPTVTSPVQAPTINKVERTTRMINRSELRANSKTLYLFGDNDVRKGLGGQAREMRNEPNAIGISTKKLPATSPQSYKTDAELDQNKKIITDDINKVIVAWDSGKYNKLIIPEMGVGLAELPTRAPQTFAFLQQELQRLENYINGSVQQVVTPVAPIQQSAQVVSQTISKSLPILSLQADNVEKVKNGTKNITNRKDPITEGMYKLPDGSTIVNLTSLGRFKVIPEKEGVTILDKSGKITGSMPKNEFAQREGFKDWADFTANNKFSENFIKNGQIRYVYSINVVIPSPTETITPTSPVQEVVTSQLPSVVEETVVDVDAEEVTTDQYKYFGRFYEIVLDKDGKAIDVVGYKGEKSAKQKLLNAYMENPNVDPQNKKPFRGEEKVNEEKQLIGTNTFEFSDGTVINTGNIILNEQQREALQLAVNAIKKGQTKFVLRGYAGTGKSTISKFIREYLQASNSFKDIRYVSPTHKASTNLLVQLIRGKIFNVSPFTTASLLNKRKGENGKYEAGPKDKMPWSGVVIVDESSMVNDEDYNLLIGLAERKGTSIIFMGDPAQLPPVGSRTLSKAMQFESSEEGVELTQVMRQKGDNPLLDIFTNIRQNLTSIVEKFSFKTNVNGKGEGIEFTKNYNEFNDKIKEYFSSNEYKEDPTYSKIVTYTNASVANYNNMIQAQLGLAPYSVGSIMMGYEQVGGSPNVHNGQDYKILNSEYVTDRNVKVFEGNVGNKYFNLQEKVSGYKVQMRRVFSKEDEKLINESGNLELLFPIDVFIINPNDERNIQFMERVMALKKVLNDGKIPWRFREDAVRQFESFFNTYQLPADMISYKGKITTIPKLKEESPELFRVDKTTGKSPFDELPSTEKPILDKNIDYGYAVTSHKAQGSTYQYVFVDYQNMENPGNDRMIMDNGVKYANERQQLKYVGLSRASKVAFVYSRKADTEALSSPQELPSSESFVPESAESFVPWFEESDLSGASGVKQFYESLTSEQKLKLGSLESIMEEYNILPAEISQETFIEILTCRL